MWKSKNEENQCENNCPLGGYVTIPVIIAARENTLLHLEGGGSWPDESAFNQTNAVRLPDGQVVGWRTAAEHSSKL